MSNPNEFRPPVLVAAEPQLFVVEASCQFFREKLGFAAVFTYGEPTFYGQVARDGARLNLRHVDHTILDKVAVERESYLSAAITVASASEINQLFLDFQGVGVEFHQTLKRKPWGARTFIVREPDGNLLLFTGPAE